ncbi:hypothetical protein TH66_11680 [Carbonactinospora thermoautotrophica]|uniref:Colicin E3-like ribonuclease domain-containing protein n=2 Tax=Carbonactinospora thermoautotrophica TaxID=1469144 RepID=A0A132N0E3_9ACTN|nr:colicin E3/pyocin S6 family cytotoxin [Carbonactinospora thermoautotrophica]KWX03527.1 hypothetical protein TH66_11680 [Carbonactinospora thermoautotrophica]
MRLRAALLGALMLVAANTQGGCEQSSAGDCRSTRAAAVRVVTFDSDEAAPKRKPRKPQKERVFNCSPGNSDYWQGLKPYKRGWRTDGKGNFYQWDYTHNDIEKWEKRGSKLYHRGSLDPRNGRPYKGPKHKPMDLPW